MLPVLLILASPLQSKLKTEQRVYTKTGEEVSVPANARSLRRSAATSPFSTTGGSKSVMSALKLLLVCLGILNLF